MRLFKNNEQTLVVIKSIFYPHFLTFPLISFHCSGIPKGSIPQTPLTDSFSALALETFSVSRSSSRVLLDSSWVCDDDSGVTDLGEGPQTWSTIFILSYERPPLLTWHVAWLVAILFWFLPYKLVPSKPINLLLRRQCLCEQPPSNEWVLSHLKHPVSE